MLAVEWRVMIPCPRILLCLAMVGAVVCPASAAPPASNKVGVQMRWAAREAGNLGP